MTCILSEWRLFIDGSTKNSKVVLLLYITSLLVAHSVHLKVTYEKMLLETLKYKEYNWEFIGDFKMVGCLWDFRVDVHAK